MPFVRHKVVHHLTSPIRSQHMFATNSMNTSGIYCEQISAIGRLCPTAQSFLDRRGEFLDYHHFI
jgi:hypothetical protein